MPTWDQFMAPVLRVLLDGEVRLRRDLYELVAVNEKLPDEQLVETLGSGELKYQNRIGWATSFLARVGALERPARGQYLITDVGRQLLGEHPDGITEHDLLTLALKQGIPGWRKVPASSEAAPAETSSDLDPVEQIETGIGRINADVSDELLTRLHRQEPTFFEQAVLDLLVGMGYGGADGKATRTRYSNDGGIDGIIDQDALGLSQVYVQAKRYAPDSSVGRPEIQAFVGALHGAQATQGVFITTGRFSSAAREYAGAVQSRLILIDGPRLTDLMIRFGVGVQVRQTLHIVEIDEDFFE